MNHSIFYHPPRATARSWRTAGTPILYVDNSGRIVGRNREGTRWRECVIILPPEVNCNYIVVCSISYRCRPFNIKNAIRSYSVLDTNLEDAPCEPSEWPDWWVIQSWLTQSGDIPAWIPVYDDRGKEVK